MSLVTYHQLGYWRDNVTLWTHTLEVTERNWVAEGHLGDALKKAGRPQDGVPHFLRALAINPRDGGSMVAMGIYEHQRGNFAEALNYYQRFLTQTDHDDALAARVLLNMADVYDSQGKTQQARESYEAAAKLMPKK
jgi:tetratricopeptide (TPR) repeat protein